MSDKKSAPKLFSIEIPYLAGSAPGWYRWEKLNLFCVYGLNSVGAMVNALESIKAKNFPIITPYGYIMSCVLMVPEEFDIYAKKVGFYIFLMINKGGYCVVPALNKGNAKEYLRQQDIKVYDGRKIKTRVLKSGQCSEDECLSEPDCTERLIFSLKLCRSDKVNPQDEPNPVSKCKLCSAEIPNGSNHCPECGWDTTYFKGGSPHVPIVD